MPLLLCCTDTDCNRCLSEACVSHDRCHTCKAGRRPPECRLGKRQQTLMWSQSVPDLSHLCLDCIIYSVNIDAKSLSFLPHFLHAKDVLLAIMVSTVLRGVVTVVPVHVTRSVESVSKTARMDGLEIGVIRLSVRPGECHQRVKAVCTMPTAARTNVTPEKRVSTPSSF